ncbi:MAG: GTPase Era [Lachnospiraceae bacterium]|nr:GTPase Era [Lachnospiraceae bacterium]
MEKKDFKSGFVALVGRPNVGKSTLMNRLIGQKIAITSSKPQTTRNRIQTVYTDERGQVIFLDTPGIHKSKNKLGKFMVETAESTFSDADVILWLVEPTNYIGAGEQYIIEKLKACGTPVILVINKIDTVKKEEILEFIATYSKQMDFAEVIPVSALRGENTSHLMDVLFSYLEEGPMYFDEDTVTDQPERQIAAEMIREKALRNLSDEVPHGIAVTIEKMHERPGGRLIDIEATIICERDSHKGIIIGKQGAMLKKIGQDARKEIEMMVGCKVNLQLWVKVKKDWRDSDVMLKNYGYVNHDEDE